MKKIMVLSLIFMFVMGPFGFAYGDMVSANQVTIGWEASMTLVDGSPIGSEDVITYNVYLADVQDIEKANPMLLGNTAELMFVVTLNMEGQFSIGVSSVRNGVIAEGIAWSDDPDSVANGAVFGVQFYQPAILPKGIYIVS